MSHRRTPRTHLAGWLALLAIALAVLMPVISRVLMAAPATTAHAGCGPDGAAHPATDPVLSPHDDAAMNACGYCGLLGHSPWLPSLARPLLTVRLPPLRLRAWPAPRPSAPLATSVAAPRGPPVPADRPTT